MFVDVRMHMTNAAQMQGSRVDLLTLANNCHCDLDSLTPVFDAAKKKILSFVTEENKFGEYLYGHLIERIGPQMESFMLHEGYAPRVAKMIGMAFALHDLGKTMQDIDIWEIKVAKHERSDYAKEQRPKHTEKGIEALNEIMEKIGFVPNAEQGKFFDIAIFMMLYHHENPIGNGPRGEKVENLCPIMNMGIALDTKDGKDKTGKPLPQIIVDMKNAPEKLHIPTVIKLEGFYIRTGELAGRLREDLALNKVS